MSLESIIPSWQRILQVGLGNGDLFYVLEEAQELGLSAFNGSIDICAFEEELGLVVSHVISKKFLPIVSEEHFSEHIVHGFSLTGQLSD